MKAPLPVRALVVVAVVTNPLTWAATLVAALAVILVAGFLLYRAVFEVARHELLGSGRRPSDATTPHHEEVPAVAAAATPLPVTEPVSRPLAIGCRPTLSPATPEPVPAPAEKADRGPARRAAPSGAEHPTVQLCERPVDELVRLARTNGAKGANRRWSRRKLIEAAAA